MRYFLVAVTGPDEITLPSEARLKPLGDRMFSIHWHRYRAFALYLGPYNSFKVFAIAASRRAGDRAWTFFRNQLPDARVLSIDDAWQSDPDARVLLEGARVRDNGSGLPDRVPHTFSGESPFITR